MPQRKGVEPFSRFWGAQWKIWTHPEFPTYLTVTQIFETQAIRDFIKSSLQANQGNTAGKVVSGSVTNWPLDGSVIIWRNKKRFVSDFVNSISTQ